MSKKNYYETMNEVSDNAIELVTTNLLAKEDGKKMHKYQTTVTKAKPVTQSLLILFNAK